MIEEKRIRVLLAQFSLETHTRPILTVTGMLRDAGMEVILIGNASPEQIIKAAIEEDVDVIGISTYCGGELVLGRDLLEEAEKQGIKDRTVFLMGGIFPPGDLPQLKEIGFDGIFGPGASREEISNFIKKAVATKAKK